MKPGIAPAFISQQVVDSQYLFVDLSPPARTAFAVTCAGREECAPDYFIHRDGFQYLAVEYILSGLWELEIAGNRYQLEAGSLFAYGPETAYKLRALPSRQRLIKLFLDFCGHEAEAQLKASGLADGRPHTLIQTRWVRDILDQLLDCGHYPPATQRAMSRLLAELLLLQLREEAKFAPVEDNGSYGTFKRCRDYLRDHFRTLRTVEEAARGCHVDPAYLARLFKRHAPETPYQFLVRLKMEHAAACLLRRNSLVKAAALEVGFEDPYHFSRVFKSRFGCSPRNFMQRAQRRLPVSGPLKD